MANPMYGQNKSDKAINGDWILCSAAGATQPAIVISGANSGYAIAPYAAKVTAIMYNLTVATTADVSVITVSDGDANAIDTCTIPIASINTGGVLSVNESDADNSIAEGEAVKVTSDGGSNAGAAMIWVKFERI